MVGTPTERGSGQAFGRRRQDATEGRIFVDVPTKKARQIQSGLIKLEARPWSVTVPDGVWLGNKP